jgi:hypothetical protein
VVFDPFDVLVKGSVGVFPFDEVLACSFVEFVNINRRV